MGKRSSFARRPGDFYPTPLKAVLPLIPHLRGVRTFAEPCCGDGALVRHLEGFGLRCVHASDIAAGQDALAVDRYGGADAIVTNPPYQRASMHALIAHFQRIAPTWLLPEFDWSATKQARPYLGACSDIVVIGRLRWIPGTRSNGKVDGRGCGSERPAACAIAARPWGAESPRSVLSPGRGFTALSSSPIGPIRSRIRADHARAERDHEHVIGKGVDVQRDIAMAGRAGYRERAHAVGAHVGKVHRRVVMTARHAVILYYPEWKSRSAIASRSTAAWSLACRAISSATQRAN